MPDSCILEIEGVAVHYGQAQALFGVSASIPNGKITSVIGANGAGKSTLIKAISGLVPYAGHIRFAGKDLKRLRSDEICELGVLQVPEGRQVFSSLSVEENLRTGALLHRARHDTARNLERVYSLFPRLAERRRQHAGTLSGGEQQMLAIGRSLMANPKLIMFDEPSLGLAPAMTDLMFTTIQELNRTGLTILLVEQNVFESLEISCQAYVLENGAVVLHGRGSELLADDRVRSAYLGL